jgi:hypothetical protein
MRFRVFHWAHVVVTSDGGGLNPRDDENASVCRQSCCCQACPLMAVAIVPD